MSEQRLRSDADLWVELVEAEERYHAAHWKFNRYCGDRVEVFRNALKGVRGRATALRLLLNAREDERRSLLPTLIDLASVGTADIGLVRDVIKSLDRTWVLQHIGRYSDPVLASGGYEEYRRLAELFRELDSPALLSELVKKALGSSDPDVREVGEDFRQELATPGDRSLAEGNGDGTGSGSSV